MRFIIVSYGTALDHHLILGEMKAELISPSLQVFSLSCQQEYYGASRGKPWKL